MFGISQLSGFKIAEKLSFSSAGFAPDLQSVLLHVWDCHAHDKVQIKTNILCTKKKQKFNANKIKFNSFI